MKGIKLLVWFHGHKCPMSTIGYKAGQLAKKLLKLKRNDYRFAFVTVYYRSCAIDGLQVSFPATYGNNNLVVCDENKMIFIFENKRKNLKLEVSFSEELIDKLQNYAIIRSKAEKEPSLLDSQKKVYKELYEFVLNGDPELLFITKFL